MNKTKPCIGTLVLKFGPPIWRWLLRKSDLAFLVFSGGVWLVTHLFACGEPFDSQTFEVSNDGASDATSVIDTSQQDASLPIDDASEDSDRMLDNDGSSLGDSSTDGPGQTTDGATPDATATDSEVIIDCPSNACTNYCAQFGKIDVCYEGKCDCL